MQNIVITLLAIIYSSFYPVNNVNSVEIFQTVNNVEKGVVIDTKKGSEDP